MIRGAGELTKAEQEQEPHVVNVAGKHSVCGTMLDGEEAERVTAGFPDGTG